MTPRTVRARTVRMCTTVAAGIMCASCSAVGLPVLFSATPRSTATGEWIDIRKTTPTDTMVWVLAADGDDALLTIHLDANGARQETRKHYGRWSEGRVTDSTGARVAALCFVRRPGRDATSCQPFAVESIATGSSVKRRLTVRGYSGAHHTTDRLLTERRRFASSTNADDRPHAPLLAAALDMPAIPTVAGGGGGSGYHPRAVQPERPSVATHAGTVAPGYWEMETGFERDHGADGGWASQVPTVLKLGISKRTQLAVNLPTTGALGTPFGVGDVAVGLKWRVIEDHPWLQDIAILPQIKLASGGARGSGTTDLSLLLINSRTFGPIGVDINAGGTWRSGDGSQAPRSGSMWAVAAGIPVRGNFGWAIETYGLPGTGGAAGTPPIVALLTGPTYIVRPELALDLGFIAPISGPQPHAIYLGLVTSLGRLVSAVR